MERRNRLRLGMALLILLTKNLVALEKRVEVPVKLCQGYCVVVRGSLGKLRNCNLVIDTGAVPTVVDSRVAKKLGLRGRSDPLSVFSRDVQTQRAILPEIRLGPVRAESVEVLVYDLSFIERGLGVRIDALVGLDVLEKSDFSIDYARGRIIFGPLEPSPSAAEFKTGPGFLVVPLEVQGETVRLLVDTGAKDLLLFKPRLEGRLAGLHIIGEKVSTNMGGELHLTRVQLPGARLGQSELGVLDAVLMESSPGALPDCDGLLGVTALGLKRLSFDFRHHLIAWQK